LIISLPRGEHPSRCLRKINNNVLLIGILGRARTSSELLGVVHRKGENLLQMCRVSVKGGHRLLAPYMYIKRKRQRETNVKKVRIIWKLVIRA
jgi:hypothetical protein